MTLRKRQDQFIDTIGQFDEQAGKFNFLIDRASLLEKECPDELLPYRLYSCWSLTYFRVSPDCGRLRVSGWSNSAVMGGLIVVFIKLFAGVPIRELEKTEIDFHLRSGLAEDLTTSRQSVMMKMIAQILSFQHKQGSNNFEP